jgi:tRNA-dihydrouridine synthase 3
VSTCAECRGAARREHRRRIEPREPKPPKAAEDPAPQDAAGGAEGAAAEGGGASKRQKKGKGQNKGRGDQKANLAARVQSALPHLCRKLVQEGACPFGDGCKFSHDVKAYLDKAAALAEPPGLECPSRKEGRPCRSRVMCRFAASPPPPPSY